jgi:hypothetical protein
MVRIVMDAERILDTLVAGRATPVAKAREGVRQLNFLQEALATFGVERGVGFEDVLAKGYQGFGDTLVQVAARTRRALGRNPGPPIAALLSATGLLLEPNRRGLMTGLVGLGGHLLVDGVVLKACRGLGLGGSPLANQARQATDDSLLLARAMIAAIASTGALERLNRAWVFDHFRQCIDCEAIDWMQCEFDSPAAVEELATEAGAAKNDPRLYAAARLAVEPEHPNAIDFLSRLASAGKLDPRLKDEIDKAAQSLKSN